MFLFQHSALKKYLILRDSKTVHKAYKKYTKYFYDVLFSKASKKVFNTMVYELYGLSAEEISIVENS